MLDWQRDMLRAGLQVETDERERYLAIPRQDSREGYRDMEKFIATVGDDRLRGRLEGAVHGRGAFRRFKDTLYQYPEEQERWHSFQDDRLRRRMLEWLAEQGIEPIADDTRPRR